MTSATKTCRCCGEDKPAELFYVGRAKCKPCLSIQHSAYRDSNKEVIASRKKEYSAANRTKIHAQQSNWEKRNVERLRAKDRDKYQENKDKILAYQAQWRNANPEKRSAIVRRWEKSNPEKQNALTAKRRAMKLCATVGWADGFIISEMYDLAKRRTTATGIVWHVDHIVPLRSEIVCGLHSHTNMQVIPGSINQMKSNRIWPGMPT